MPRNVPIPVFIASVAAALLAAIAIPASAGVLDGSNARADGAAAAEADADAAVELRCGARVGDTEAAVQCEWTAEVDVRAWQVWRAQTRPETGERELVAELTADVHGHVDTGVEVPAAYLYAVLGLDGDGEVIARSRLEVVSVGVDVEIDVEGMRLDCAAHRVETNDRPDVSIGCEWSAAADGAAAVVVWKSVDGGERSVLARLGSDATTVRDDAVAFGHRYHYVVTAVDAEGEVVGRSRAELVGIPALDLERPVDVASEAVADVVMDTRTDAVADSTPQRPEDPAEEPTDRADEPSTDQPEARPAARPAEPATGADVTVRAELAIRGGVG